MVLQMVIVLLLEILKLGNSEMNKKIKLQNYKLSSKNMAETKQQSTSADRNR